MVNYSKDLAASVTNALLPTRVLLVKLIERQDVGWRGRRNVFGGSASRIGRWSGSSHTANGKLLYADEAIGHSA